MTYRDLAIVLTSSVRRDADRYYVLYTREHGKVVLLAKGSRRGTSKMASHMAIFGVVDIMVAEGRLIDRLAGAALTQSYAAIADSFEKMSLAQAFLLSVDALTKRSLPDERVFALAESFLAALARETVFVAPGERHPLFDAAFVKLLDLLGFGLELSQCVSCRRQLEPQGNGLATLRGGIECARCREPLSMDISDSAIKALRYFREQSLGLVPVLCLSNTVRRELRLITDLLFTIHSEGRFSALQYLKMLA